MPGGNDSSTQTSEPWGPQQPYLKNIMSEAERMYTTQGPDYFPGSTVVPFSPETNLALTAQANRAMSGSPLTGASSDLLQSTIEGDFLNSNPYLDATFDRGAGKIRNALDSQFNAMGRFGSGAQAAAAGEAYTNLANDLYGGNYARERGIQMQAAGMAPQLAQQDYADIAALGQVGAAREGQATAELQDQINRFNFYQQLPANKLAQYQQFINGNYGGTGTTTGPASGGSPLVRGAGGALSGAAAGSAIMPGWGTAIGAGIGGLAGLLG